MRALIACFAIVLTLPAVAEDKGSWFKSLMRPGGEGSCCDAADCKVNEGAYFDQATRTWVAIVDGKPVPVPDDKILKDRESWDGRAYACIYQGAFLCFIRPGGGA